MNTDPEQQITGMFPGDRPRGDAPAPAAHRIPNFTILGLRAKHDQARHSYIAGMKNVVYLAGIARSVSDTRFYMQLTNNRNLQLPVYLPSGVRRVDKLKEGAKIKVIGHVIGMGKTPEGRREFAVVAVGFDRPNVLEMPGVDAWNKAVPPKADEDKDTKPFGSGYRVQSAANQVKIAGFVHAMDVREPIYDEESGQTTSPRLLITVRQHEDPDRMFDLTYYGHLASYVAGRIKRGHPYYFEGRYRVRLHETGETSEDGRPIVRQEPYIHIEPPQTPTVEDIMFLGNEERTPSWVREILQKSSARTVVGEAGAGKASAPSAPVRHSFHETPVLEALPPQRATPANVSAAELEAARALIG